MQGVKMRHKGWLSWPWSASVYVFSGVALVVVGLDQWTKWLAVAHLTHAFSVDLGQPALDWGEKVSRFLWMRDPIRSGAVSVLDDFWHFRYVQNPGAAFGFLSGSTSAWRTPFFTIVSLGAMVFIVSYFRKTTPKQKILRSALALVMGGAIGNFVDRVRLGYVIDFIDWHWYDKARWPTFNIADAAISVGVALLLLDVFMNPQSPTSQKTSKAS